jgi:glycosyltransferase involved in cell wall biosynthesis
MNFLSGMVKARHFPERQAHSSQPSRECQVIKTNLPYKSQMIRFSIVVPTFNASKFVGETIDSILRQSNTDYEAIFVDDGSVDNSREIIIQYASLHPGRFSLIEQSHQGSTVARNAGIQQSRGEYIVALDHDDLLLPNALEIYEKVIRYFSEPPLILATMISILVIIPGKKYLALSLRIFFQRQFLWALAIAVSLPGRTPFWKQEDIKNVPFAMMIEPYYLAWAIVLPLSLFAVQRHVLTGYTAVMPPKIFASLQKQDCR